MDYGVFLISRIREYWCSTGPSRRPPSRHTPPANHETEAVRIEPVRSDGTRARGRRRDRHELPELPADRPAGGGDGTRVATGRAGPDGRRGGAGAGCPDQPDRGGVPCRQTLRRGRLLAGAVLGAGSRAGVAAPVRDAGPGAGSCAISNMWPATACGAGCSGSPTPPCGRGFWATVTPIATPNVRLLTPDSR